MKGLQIPEPADRFQLQFGFADDFLEYVTADLWTTVATDSGGVTHQDAVGGRILLDASDGTVADNDETYVHTTKEIFLFAADKPISLEALLQFTEANTDDANVLFGLMNAAGANALQDDGAGPKASYSGAVFFTVDGETEWSVESSSGATQKTTKLDADGSLTGSAITAGTASGTFSRLRIDCVPRSSTRMDYLFYHNNILVAKHLDQSYSSATEMDVIFGVKNGDSNEETLLIDYCWAYQLR